ncbi:hypothetical protein GE061_005772 [Apolygus lucorum]|uniref:Uncharacterized protein n=1 Tax=Apolygus lucorum TaxID=248454 RepID=A0A8S9WYM0_APOLU|nr:hypothetical protein GE061_005772 [Apolygus lucorum]
MLDLKHLVQTTVFNRNVDDAGEKVSWLKVKVFQYRRDTPASIGYKYNYEEDDFRRIPLGTASVRRSRHSTSKMTEALPPLYHKQLPILEAKKRDLITLCRKNVIPKNLQQWFHNLPTSKTTVDRAAEPAMSDDSDEEF